jgi:hypothetical protein
MTMLERCFMLALPDKRQPIADVIAHRRRAFALRKAQFAAAHVKRMETTR